MKYLLIPVIVIVLLGIAYLAACAGANRFLSFEEWWPRPWEW